MTTGYEIREGARMIAERVEPERFWAVVDQRGDVYAIRSDKFAAHQAHVDAVAYLSEARDCGHELAFAWVAERLPLDIVEMTASERAAALEDATPILDREPIS